MNDNSDKSRSGRSMQVKKLDPVPEEPAFLPKAKSIKLRLLTHNIWNNTLYYQERLSAIVRTIKNRAPDVICLIDVSVHAFQEIENQLESNYNMFQVFTEEGENAGTVLLCNKNTIDFPEDSSPYYYDFPGSGRIIGADVCHRESGYRFHILGTRLDDHPDNDNVRENQCNVVCNVVRKLDNFVLMGDMNFYTRNERGEVRINEFMSDTWVKIGCPPELRFTYNGKTNPIIRSNEKLRNSRIYYKSKSRKHGLAPKSMSLVGMENISSDIKMPASPYYGLETIYEIK